MANHVQDIVEILIMALALGMDAFSLAIGIGLKGIQRRQAIALCLLIGACHIVMPMIGIYTGILLQEALGKFALWLGAFLLLGLGVHMLLSSLFGSEDTTVLSTTTVGMALFALSVSIDALSVGFSLGLRSTTYGIVATLAFGFFAVVMSGMGLLVGKHFNRMSGKLGEIIGALILIGYGVHFLVA